jgi:SPASM domain peptide maturase of grasp-with-spasm system
MIEQGKPFKIFACCIAVQGKFRSIICDVQRGKIDFIPNGLFEILKEYDGKTIADVKNAHDVKDQRTIDEYFDFLIKEEYIFFSHHPEAFPRMSLTWQSPNIISNAIIDIEKPLPIDLYRKFAIELEEFGCKYLQIRVYNEISILLVEEIIASFFKSRVESVELLIKKDESLQVQSLESLGKKYARIRSVIVHSAEESTHLISSPRFNVFYSVTGLSNSKYCGFIPHQYFSVNRKMFTESHHHNSCLNRKIAIDAEGNIKNCPSMPQSFGNIKDTALAEALAHPDFKKYWNITKDQVKVCQDCEFRYICTDCRAYLEDPRDDYSKPLKCGYDPYTGQWAEWSTHPLKQRAIDYYGMREIL